MHTQISDVVKTGGLLLLLSLIAVPGHATPQIVGKISFARGSAAAQRPGETPRILGKDAEIFQGDNIQTTERSFVIIEFADGAKITVRPNSSFSIDQYDTQAKNPKAQLSLHEGGVRASSGDIANQNPENFQIKTGLATVKAQQADYSIRLCKQDCEQETPQAAEHAPVKTDQSVIARVADIKGEVLAKNHGDKNAKERQLSLGGPLYSEDYLRSRKDSYALMVFRDGEKITLQADSEMDIAQYHYQQDGTKDHVLYRLTTGGMRALTGSIGKTDKEAYAIDTPVGTIGIRGTGFDLSCIGDCVDGTGDISTQQDKKRLRQDDLSEGLYTRVWQGQIALTNETGEHLLTMPDSYYIAGPKSDAFLFPNLPDTLFNITPRPDRNNSDIRKLFAAQTPKGTPSGLYVTVHNGHVQLTKEGGEKATLDLGKDEVGLVSPQQNMTRLTLQPQFQTQDAYPLPDQFNEQQAHTGVYSLLNDNDGKGGGDACQSPD